MKRLFVAAALVIAATALSSGAASAAPAPQTANCQQSSGDGAIRSASSVTVSKTGNAIGAVQLCKDSSSRFWGYMVLYNSLPSGWATAYLDVYLDVNGKPTFQATYSCDGSTPQSSGNKHIAPGQTLCWTPKIYGTNTGYTYQAYSQVFSGSYPNHTGEYASGSTVRLR